MMRGAAVLSLFVALAQAPQPSESPRPAPTPPVFASGVELVALDVGVVDEGGRPVPDLRLEDFEIRVRGKPRRVVTVEFIPRSGEPLEERATPPSSAFSSNEGLAQGRLVLLAVDQGNIQMGEGRNVVRAAERLLARLGPADRVGLLTLPGPQPRQEFTTDHERVRRAIQGLAGQARFYGQRLSLLEALASAEHEDESRWQAALERECPGGDPGCTATLEGEARELWAEYQTQSTHSLTMLRAAFEALKSIEGTKVLVLVTQGLGLPGSGPRTRVTSDLPALGAAARVARVSFYVVRVDPGPLPGMESRVSAQLLSEDRAFHEAALDFLADAARGTVFRGVPELAFERIAREMSGYYQVGFEPEDRDRDGKDYKVSVTVRRRGLTVRSPGGVTIPKPGSAPDAAAALSALLRSPLVVADLPLRTATWALKDPANGKLRVLFDVEVGQEAVPAGVALAYLLLDAKGHPAASGLQPAREEGAAEGGASSWAMLTLEPGRYTLRVAARDRRGRSGSVEHPVAAALWEAAGLELSDLMLGPAPAPGRRFHPAPYPAAALPDGMLACQIEIYSRDVSRLDAASVWLDVVRADSDVTLKSLRPQLTAPQAGRRVARAFVPAAGLSAGHYTLRANLLIGGQQVAALARPFQVVAP